MKEEYVGGIFIGVFILFILLLIFCAIMGIICGIAEVHNKTVSDWLPARVFLPIMPVGMIIFLLIPQFSVKSLLIPLFIYILATLFTIYRYAWVEGEEIS